jgi:hypothetical protein
VAGGAPAAGTAFGATPVASSEAPTEDRPPLGNEFVVSELDNPDDAGDEPMEDMPLMCPAYHFRARDSLGSKRP